MQYRRLGRTNYEVSEIGFGAWGIGKRMWVGADDGQSLRALHESVDRGLNFIDTALAYGDGHSERLIGEFLRQRSERLYVASKIPPKNLRWPAEGKLREVFPVAHLVACTERSLRNLNVERLDLMQLHVWSPEWLAESEWYDTLSELRRQGKIAYFGISINDHQPGSALALVQSGKVDTVQVIYNIFDQSPERQLFPLCQEEDVGVIARVPFDEGALTGAITPNTSFPDKDWRNQYFKDDRKQQVSERIRKIEPLLGEEASSLPELALRFCLHHPAVSSVIPGMRSEEHVAANIGVSDGVPLSSRLLEKLREHQWEKNFYP